jgi:hypothetical protein
MRVDRIAGMTHPGLESAAVNHDIRGAGPSMAKLDTTRVRDGIVGQDTEETRPSSRDG